MRRVVRGQFHSTFAEGQTQSWIASEFTRRARAVPDTCWRGFLFVEYRSDVHWRAMLSQRDSQSVSADAIQLSIGGHMFAIGLR